LHRNECANGVEHKNVSLTTVKMKKGLMRPGLPTGQAHTGPFTRNRQQPRQGMITPFNRKGAKVMRSSPSLTRDGARVHTQCSCHPAGATATGAGRTSEQVSEWHQSQASCTVAFTPTLWELG
jgi:hypothetical protein